MTSKNMEARRAEFDAWHRAEQEEKWQSALKEFGLEPEPMPEQFLHAAKLLHWRIWNAALDSICVELPAQYDYHSPAGMLRGCKEALTAAGVAYK